MMRSQITRLSSVCVLALCFALLGLTGCGNKTTCTTNDQCSNGQVCNGGTCSAPTTENPNGGDKNPVDGGNTDKSNPTDTPQTDTPQTDTPQTEGGADGDGGGAKEVDPNGICPPGCGDCDGKEAVATQKLELGERCNEPTKGGECTSDANCDAAKKEICAKPNDFSATSHCYAPCTADKDCSDGLRCLKSADGKSVCTQEEPCKTGMRCIQNGIENRGYCYISCKADADCDQGQKCLDGGLCGVQNDAGQTCNFSRQAFCIQGVSCLVSDVENTAGTCYKSCTENSECPATKNQVCRLLNSNSTNKYCQDEVLDGPLCVGQACTGNSTAQNCQKGLLCYNGFCVKTCKKDTGDTDCDTAGGETCAFISLSSPRICQQAPSVKEAGKECSFFNQCDGTLGLECVQFTAEKSVCVKKCDQNKSDPTGGNPVCTDKQLCRVLQGRTGGLCFAKAEINDPCNEGQACPDKSICVNFGGDEAYCLKECDTGKNKSEDDNTNEECENGKGSCIGLSSGDRGACLPVREKTLGANEGCATNGNLKAPDCKEGLRCVGLGGQPVCYPDCDPCTAKVGSDGTWVHPNCDGGKGACTPLVYSDGRPAGGICRTKGNPVIDEDDFCGIKAGEDCKDGLVCVTFSSAADANAVCSKECDPGQSGSEQCQSGNCGRLTSGGGVCIPAPQRRAKVGEECLGDIGTPGFHDCLEKDDKGNQLICARPAFPGAKRSCQIRCNPVNGLTNNDDCKKQGLTNHLCLPADTNSPTKGACLELCQQIDPQRCKSTPCKIGACQSTNLGKAGDCTTPEKEKECKDQGGTCTDKTCVVSVCN